MSEELKDELQKELKRFYTTEQVAELFEISNYTAREWMRTGKIRAHKFHGYWRASEEALKEFAREMIGESK